MQTLLALYARFKQSLGTVAVHIIFGAFQCFRSDVSLGRMEPVSYVQCLTYLHHLHPNINFLFSVYHFLSV